MAEEGGWCLIESDPGVFFGLFEALGVQGLTFQEVYGLDAGAFEALQEREILGFVFLFNYNKDRSAASSDSQPQQTQVVDPFSPDAPFFARQTVQNACASQALLSVLLNIPPEKFEAGSELKALIDFLGGVEDPSFRGQAIGACEAVRAAHNSFRPQFAFEFGGPENSKDDEEAFHFVAYVPKGGKVYELDGLKEGPLCVGASSNSSPWTEVARLEIQRRVQQLQGELRFSLIAVTADPLPHLAAQIAEAKSLSEDPNAQSPEARAQAEAKLRELTEKQTAEISLRERWRKENERRRHDFVPFALCALKHLARMGKLVRAVEAAKQSSPRS